MSFTNVYYLCLYNRTSCAQVQELPQSHCGDKREGEFFIHCVCSVDLNIDIDVDVDVYV